jgi:dienelactone hydrolase
MLLFLLACPAPDKPATLSDDGCTHLAYEGLAPYPSNHHTVADSSTATGIRLALDPTEAPLTKNGEPAVPTELLAGFDGFSRLAPVVLAFTAPVGPLEERADGPEDPIFLLDTTGNIAPSRLTISEDGLTVTLWPDATLSAATLHASIIQSSLPTGNCFSAGETFADPAELETAQAAAEALGASPAAAVPFTTRSMENELALYTALQTRLPNLIEEDAVNMTLNDCAIEDFSGYCDTGTSFAGFGTVTLPKFQADDGAFKTDNNELVEQGSEDLSFYLLVPENARMTPAPIAILQHGLGGDKDAMVWMARALVDAGYAVVAINAVAHGDRPHEGSPTTAFFGIDFDRWHVEAARDNIRQTAIDHMGLLEALSQQAFDGFSIDFSNRSYVGQSLGAIIGANSCALNPSLDRCVLNVPGGRLVEIIRANTGYAALLNIFFELPKQERELELFSALAQGIVDEGDPAIMAPRILSESPARPVLVQEATEDETIPNQTTEVMARSMGIPLLLPSIEEITGMETESMPVLNNLTRVDAIVTAGLTQFNANHAFLYDGTIEGQRAMDQAIEFLSTSQIDIGE